MSGKQDWLLLSEAADYLRRTPSSLYQWRLKRFGPPSLKAGNRVLYRQSDLDAWLESEGERNRVERGEA